MGFLRTNDLSEIKTDELNLDFGFWLKTGGVVGCKLSWNALVESRMPNVCDLGLGLLGVGLHMLCLGIDTSHSTSP